MAIKDVQIWILTAFSLVPTKDLMRRWVLMCLKNTSIFHRSLYNSATVAAVHSLWLVKKYPPEQVYVFIYRSLLAAIDLAA
jgi:hypothetical protein